jgi:hypothetical protein
MGGLSPVLLAAATAVAMATAVPRDHVCTFLPPQFWPPSYRRSGFALSSQHITGLEPESTALEGMFR